MSTVRTIIFLILVIVPSVCRAQQQKNWDEALDRYELICERCLELKHSQEDGKSIPKESISSLRTQLTMLRNSLMQVRGQMSAAQRARFDMIRQRFGDNAASKTAYKVKPKAFSVPVESRKDSLATAVVRPPVDDSVKTRGTLCKIDKIERPALEYNARKLFSTTTITRPVKKSIVEAPKSLTKYMIGVQAAVYPLQSYGLMIGALFDSDKRICCGGYIKGLSDFRFKPVVPSYSCNSSGMVADGNKIWSNGEATDRRFSVTAGGIMRIGAHFGFNLGAGYGSTRYFIEDVNGNWADVSDISVRGVVVEAGIMFFFGKNIWANAGASTTSFRYLEPCITVGFAF